MNQEFNLYDYFEPVYINSSNEVFPLINDVLSSLCDTMLAFIVIVFQTGTFILKEAITHIDTNLSLTEKLILCFCLYNLILIYVLDIDRFYENKEIQTKMERILTQYANLDMRLNDLEEIILLKDKCDNLEKMRNKMKYLKKKD